MVNRTGKHGANCGERSHRSKRAEEVNAGATFKSAVLSSVLWRDKRAVSSCGGVGDRTEFVQRHHAPASGWVAGPFAPVSGGSRVGGIEMAGACEERAVSLVSSFVDVYDVDREARFRCACWRADP